MNKFVSKPFIIFFIVVISSGCASMMKSSHNDDYQKEDIATQDKSSYFLRLSSKGSSKAFGEFDSLQDRQYLQKEALADAYKNLGEKIYNTKVFDSYTVKDIALKNSRVNKEVDLIVNDAIVVEEKYSNGNYVTMLELKISKESWQKIFSF